MATAKASTSLEGLSFDNRFTHELPADPSEVNVPRQVHEACFSRVRPVGFDAPSFVAHASEVAELLGLAPDVAQSTAFAEVFSGSRVLEGMDPFAMCYGGHQFGQWAGQLGDGRAIGLGDVINGDGERWALQLKGAGPTPYARGADGYAVLRSSLREFLVSEAMHHLGVPTTRALSLILTGEQVVRDMFYDGHPRPEPGAVVCRVAPSFTRFGNFELFARRREVDVLRQLADYTIRVDFPHLGEPGADTYATWFDEVCQRTLSMIVEWMRVGFVHGVMNTDNMSILGLTIDYGPYGWLEPFDPGWTPNTTDAHGRRYRFGSQPEVALWNLVKLAEAIHPLIGETEPLESALESYTRRYPERFRAMMATKLGITLRDDDADAQLIEDLLELMPRAEVDMTIFFRRLATVTPVVEEEEGTEPFASIEDAFYELDALAESVRSEWNGWLSRYRSRLANDPRATDERWELMNRVNPKYVLRNYMAQLASDKVADGDASLLHELLDVLRRPYDEQPDKESFAVKRPEWARNRPGCSMLSCSS